MDSKLEVFLLQRYGHLPHPVYERIVKAYEASQQRDSDAFLKEKGVDVYTTTNSTNYKKHLFIDE